MKLFYSLVFTLLISVGLFAQNDTLLWQDFQEEILNMMEIPEFDSVGTNNWYNWDSDGLADANARPQNWFWTNDFYQLGLDSIAPTDSNFVFGSSSWLEGFADGNRNWLTTPPIVIGDDQAMLHFKSAPRQGPRYMDGYSVLVSTTDYFNFSFTDTLYRHKQMIPPLPNGASDYTINAFNVDSFLYAPSTYLDYEGITQEAYIHDNGYSGAYTDPDTAGNLFIGILEPHSLSLAKYAGETIYIAFLHDSDDDNLIYIDDILVTGNEVMVAATEPLLDVRYMLYPNPATHVVNLSYRFVEQVDKASIVVYDVSGKALIGNNNLNRAAGEYTQKVDVRKLPAGHYTVVLSVDGKQATKKFVKQ